MLKRRKNSRKPMTLRAKINLLVLLDVSIVLILVSSVFSYILVQMKFNDIGQRAVALANVVADMPTIIEAFSEPDPSKIIQPIAEQIRQETGAEFVVVGNMELRRYSHPNPNNIGKTMVGGDNELVLKGQASITKAVGTLGLSVRGKAPVFDTSGRQIGVVSVGYLVDDIWMKIVRYLVEIGAVGLLGLGIGLVGAYLLSGHIKKQILNMEPFEIAFMTQEQAAILESIREGIIAVDKEGKINACNQEAKRLLEIDPLENIIGKLITEVAPNSRLPEVLTTGITLLDQPMILGNTLVVINIIPVKHSGKVIGAVSSFRDKMQLDQIDNRLADVRRYVDALRSQRHEFMNKLHTIAGLIAIKEYAAAAQLIDKVNDEQQRVLEFFLARIRDSAVVGILLGKMHRAKELGVQLLIDPESRLHEECFHRELLVTILGNAIENSFEAFLDWKDKVREPVVTVYVSDENNEIVVEVRDTGPGVNPELKDHIFEDGVSTKGAGRGFGLALISRRIANISGTINIKSSTEGTILRAVFPK